MRAWPDRSRRTHPSRVPCRMPARPRQATPPSATQHPRDDARGDEADSNPDRAACDAQREGLDQELHQHVASARAERHAQPDLARPLGDRHQHDVHDADAAHHERDGGDAGEQHRQRPAGLLQRAGHLFERDLIELRQVGEHEHRRRCVETLGERLGGLGLDSEVVGAASGQVVTRPQHRPDFGRNARCLAGLFGGHRDGLEARESAQVLKCGHGHEDRIGLVFDL